MSGIWILAKCYSLISFTMERISESSYSYLSFIIFSGREVIVNGMMEDVFQLLPHYCCILQPILVKK